MDKKVTKKDFIREIRKHFKELGIPKGGNVTIDKVVSRRKVICGDKTYIVEVKVVSVTRSKAIVEWYKNGERENYSGEYPLENVNVGYHTAWAIEDELWQMVREKAA